MIESASSLVTGQKLNAVKLSVKRNEPTSKIPCDVIHVSSVMGGMGPQSGGEGTGVEDLQTLVDRRLKHLKQQHGFSARDAVLRATRAGFPIGAALFSQIRKRPAGERWGPPQRKALLGIAAGLDLLDQEVLDAAYRSAGYKVPHRVYRRKRRPTERVLCDCNPTCSSVFGEVVVELPHTDFTCDEIDELVQELEKAATRLRERRTLSE